LKLLLASDIRGKDASGILVVRSNGTYEMQKAPLEAEKFVPILQKMKKIISEAVLVVGHTRAATVGKPDNNANNHPIESDDWIMVHNGSCTMMNKVKDYNYRGEVDSEVLLSHLQVGGFDGLKQLDRGSAAIAFINKSNPLDLYIWRDGNPCYIGINAFSKTDRIIFASTDHILKQVSPYYLKLFSSLKTTETLNRTLYKLTRNPIDIDEVGMYDTCNPPKPKYEIITSSMDRITRVHTTSWQGDFHNCSYDTTHHIGNTPIHYTNGMVWNEKERRWYINPHRNRYYLKSHDFDNWTKLGKPFKGYMSSGADLMKFYDKERNMHFVITTEDAQVEELIPTTMVI
jgi:hypothetical protein